MSLSFHAPLLRSVADRLRLPTVITIARSAGIIGVWRVTVHYYDGRFPDTVATLTRRTGPLTTLDLYSERADDQPRSLSLIDARWDTFNRAVLSLGFDTLPDQPNLPVYDTTDIWLIERAAGVFVHSVIVAPTLADAAWKATGGDRWSRLVSSIYNGLPEAVTPQERS